MQEFRAVLWFVVEKGTRVLLMLTIYKKNLGCCAQSKDA